jgi:hypothetical protein
MEIENIENKKCYYLRAEITHTFKAGPGFDLLGRKAFISEEQALYIYRILQINESVSQEKEKLFIKGSIDDLKGLGSSIIAMSP